MYTSLACGMNVPREYPTSKLNNNNACKHTEKQTLLLVSGFTFTLPTILYQIGREIEPYRGQPHTLKCPVISTLKQDCLLSQDRSDDFYSGLSKVLFAIGFSHEKRIKRDQMLNKKTHKAHCAAFGFRSAAKKKTGTFQSKIAYAAYQRVPQHSPMQTFPLRIIQ